MSSAPATRLYAAIAGARLAKQQWQHVKTLATDFPMALPSRHGGDNCNSERFELSKPKSFGNYAMLHKWGGGGTFMIPIMRPSLCGQPPLCQHHPARSHCGRAPSRSKGSLEEAGTPGPLSQAWWPTRAPLRQRPGTPACTAPPWTSCQSWSPARHTTANTTHG